MQPNVSNRQELLKMNNAAISKRLLFPFLLFSFLILSMAYVYAQQQTTNRSLTLSIIPEKMLSGTAGDFVTLNAQINNSGPNPINDITTYISLVDESNKVPVDLEDWSAEKGLFIGTIDSGQALPLSWKIHFVKAGTYSLIIVAEVAGQEIPQVSTIVHFTVNPKRNLNPGQVLPVALGTPIILIFILLVIGYKRHID
jgi:hypothetical protein